MKADSARVAILLVSLVALGLAAVPFLPGFLPGTPVEEGLTGHVVDERGSAVPAASIFLFDTEHRRLVQQVQSGPKGEFTIHLALDRSRLFVQPPEASKLACTWGPAELGEATELALVLSPARELSVRVRDSSGSPVPEAEVRAYETGDEPAVIALARCDEEGKARLLVPERVHVGVLPESPSLAPRWSLDLAVSKEGHELELTLPSAAPIRGEVRGAHGPLEGILLIAWEDGPGGEWNGFARSDVEGRFELARTTPGTVVRAVDPRGVYLPLRMECVGPPPVPLVLAMERGSSLVVRPAWGSTSSEARIWSWSPTAGTWSFGARTEAGAARLPVETRFGVHADPLDPALSPIDAWDLVYQSEELRLEGPPTR